MMGIERIPEGEQGPTFTAEQMMEVVGERDTYRAALYDATNARLVGADKMADALGRVDTLHRELHTVSGERDKARRELSEADRILDSPRRAIVFTAGVLRQVSRERIKARQGRLRSSGTRFGPRRTQRR